MLKILSKEAYQEASKNYTERSFMQTVEMAELLERRGFKVTYLGWVRDGEVTVSGILYTMPETGGLRMEVNSGPGSSKPEDLKHFYSALRDYAKANGALELIIKPYDTYQTFDSNGQAISEERKELIADLTDLGYAFDGLTKETLRKSYSKKGRPLANKTSSFGIKVRTLTRDELSIFKEITSSTSERREYKDKSLDYYQDFYDSFGDKAEFVVATLNFKDYLAHLQKDMATHQKELDEVNEKLAENPDSAKQKKLKTQLEKQLATFETRVEEAKAFIDKYGEEDVVLAGSLFIYTPQEVVYLFSGSYTEFNKFYAPVVLQEHVMTKAIEKGIPFYTFLGIQGIFDGSDGVLRFKQNFNGYIVRKMGTFRYYPKPMKYKMIKGVKKLLRRY